MMKYFFVRSGGRFIKIALQEIDYVEGYRNYVKIVTDKKSFLVLITMKRMEELLPSGLFRRIHKSFIVSLDSISEFDTASVWIKGRELPIGQLYKGDLESCVVIASEFPLADKNCRQERFNKAV